MKLNRDIISALKKDKKEVIYGKRGDTVTLIADYGTVKIVSKNGDRFPVKEKDLKQD